MKITKAEPQKTAQKEDAREHRYNIQVFVQVGNGFNGGGGKRPVEKDGAADTGQNNSRQIGDRVTDAKLAVNRTNGSEVGSWTRDQKNQRGSDGDATRD